MDYAVHVWLLLINNKMVYPRLVNNLTCGDIPALISNINCRMMGLSYALYNNTIYAMNKKVAPDDMLRLITYKEILTIKYCDPDYLKEFTLPMIASKVKLLTLNCKSKCVYDKATERQ
jgi:hypothetical protein